MATDSATDDILDVVIVGGGITGAGIARDATLRGLRVALFEKEDFGSGTSSKSSKLIHGGLRYLEHGEIGLVFESVSERRVQTMMAPHLVRPLPFLVPIYKDNRVGLETMNLGLWIYDTLALFRSPKMHKTFRGKKAKKIEPLLKNDDLQGAIEYYDCFTDDCRLVLENILSACERGADCRSYHKVVGIDRVGEGEDRRVTAVRVQNVLTGTEETVRTRCVIVAVGPWTDGEATPLGFSKAKPFLRPTKGVHLVFPSEKLPLTRAVTIISPVDGRVMFAIPWRGRTVIGTTDTDFEGSPDEVHADAEDVQYLCDSANSYFPKANFSPDEVIATWAGLRPLIHEDAEDESDVSREHHIYVRDDGVVMIAGGKLTTYRIMAKETVKKAIGWLDDNGDDDWDDRAISRPRTKKRPLPGAVEFEDRSVKGVKRFAKTLAKDYGIARELAEHLAFIYGVRARRVLDLVKRDAALGEPLQNDLPYIWAEIDFAYRYDLAQTIDDVLSRRVPLLLVGRDQGLDILERATARMAEHQGWDETRVAEELMRYRRTVADSRLFRTA